MDEMAGWVAQRRAETAGDRLFLLTHPPVITYGRRTPASELPAASGIPAVPADRGGYATYHGPGQLVGYLVVKLGSGKPGQLVRWVETRLIAAMAELGFTTYRRDTEPGGKSLVGVWAPGERKLASVGMRIRDGISSHGFAVNIDPEMSVFRAFTVCGLPDVTMTSLAELAREQGRRTPGGPAVSDAVAAAFDAPVPWQA
ncbi:lipoyl(octanoyl) transferase LipB [Amycolatopsis sp. RM579]|uniref:Octanoyltransferase n=2 Tax=Amycolatopsis pithecellobii TaxID=664692 RepID=A0A6N7YWW2_9PSEU|nr:lipoyl(octanoyl) transferase LipB [Amycolatopsis pithecellobii]